VHQAGCARHGQSSSPGEAAIKEERAKQERIRREGYVDRPVAGHDRWRRRRERADDRER
jgi:hypothetical protein